jgi:hypothetical protein
MDYNQSLMSGNTTFFTQSLTLWPLGGTLYEHKRSYNPLAYAGEDLPGLLAAAYERDGITDKEQQLLISPAVFDAGLGADGEWRTYDNIRHMSGYVFLDFDGGDLPPTTFCRRNLPRLADDNVLIVEPHPRKTAVSGSHTLLH